MQHRSVYRNLTLFDSGAIGTSSVISIVNGKVSTISHTDTRSSGGIRTQASVCYTLELTDYTVFRNIEPVPARSNTVDTTRSKELRTNMYNKVDIFQLRCFCGLSVIAGKII